MKMMAMKMAMKAMKTQMKTLNLLLSWLRVAEVLFKETKIWRLRYLLAVVLPISWKHSLVLLILLCTMAPYPYCAANL